MYEMIQDVTDSIGNLKNLVISMAHNEPNSYVGKHSSRLIMDLEVASDKIYSFENAMKMSDEEFMGKPEMGV
jgi:hypothetical protein